MRIIAVISLLSFANVMGAGSPNSRERLATDQILVSDQQVSEWLRVWQKRLRLEDWRIDTRIVRSWELEPGTLGHIDWSISKKAATIKVLSPLDYNLPLDRVTADMELSVVHELVHLRLAVLPLGKSSRTVEERVVSELADALVSLDRRPVRESQDP